MQVNGLNGELKTINRQGWMVGLLNYAHKYLTAESFGCKINVSGVALKKKQVFTLVQDLRDEVLYIKSHLGRYVSADKYGNVTCEVEDGDQGRAEQFVVEYDNKGRWAFKNVQHHTYLGGNEDELKCKSTVVGMQEKWQVQLSIHPQVNLRNVNRRRYAHVRDDQLQCSQLIPWTVKSLVFLDYQSCDGCYTFKTYDNRYLDTSGNLVESLSDNCKFMVEIHSGQNNGLAFRDRFGCYLTGVGSTAHMKCRNKSVTKDELFTLEDTHPQVVLVANNGKKVSTKQGVDVSANQRLDEEETDHEVFQMEFQPQEQKWCFRTVDNKLWKLEPIGGIQASVDRLSAECLFKVEWQADGSVAILASNNNYIYNKQTGSLVAGSDVVCEKACFQLKIINRPILVLKSDHGFVGTSVGSRADVICCNRAAYEVIGVEVNTDGSYFFKGANGKYWYLASNGSIVGDGAGRSAFGIQCRDNRVLTITADNGLFIKGEQNGMFRAVASELGKGVLWEY